MRDLLYIGKLFLCIYNLVRKHSLEISDRIASAAEVDGLAKFFWFGVDDAGAVSSGNQLDSTSDFWRGIGRVSSYEKLPRRASINPNQDGAMAKDACCLEQYIDAKCVRSKTRKGELCI